MNYFKKSINRYQQSVKVGLLGFRGESSALGGLSSETIKCLTFCILLFFWFFTPVTAHAAARLQMPPNYLVTGSGLVPLEVQPASGLAVATGDLLLTGLVGYWTMDCKDTMLK